MKTKFLEAMRLTSNDLWERTENQDRELLDSLLNEWFEKGDSEALKAYKHIIRIHQLIGIEIRRDLNSGELLFRYTAKFFQLQKKLNCA